MYKVVTHVRSVFHNNYKDYPKMMFTLTIKRETISISLYMYMYI